MEAPEVNETCYDGFSVHFHINTSSGGYFPIIKEEIVYGTIIGEHASRLLVEEHPPNFSNRIVTITEAFLHKLADMEKARPTLKYLTIFTFGGDA